MQEIKYIQSGEYLIPDLTLPEHEGTYGKYGMLRRTYLKEHRPGTYAALLLSGELHRHLIDLDREAHNRMERDCAVLVQQAEITEEDKARDFLLWVGTINNIRHCAEEVILNELIYN